MSDTYLAVVRYNNKTTSVKFTFVATDPNEAMVEMRKASGVKNIADLHEFQLIRAVPGGYVVTAERFANQAKVVDNKPSPPPLEEKHYTPYTKAAA